MTAETNALTFVVVVANVAILAGASIFWVVPVNEAIPAVYILSLLVSMLSRTHAGERRMGRGSDATGGMDGSEHASGGGWASEKADGPVNGGLTFLEVLPTGGTGHQSP